MFACEGLTLHTLSVTEMMGKIQY